MNLRQNKKDKHSLMSFYSKFLFLKLYIMKKTCIHCKTKKEAENVFLKLMLQGYKWNNEEDLKMEKTEWEEDKKATVYFLQNDKTILV